MDIWAVGEYGDSMDIWAVGEYGDSTGIRTVAEYRGKREAARKKDGDRNGKISEELQRADPGH